MTEHDWLNPTRLWPLWRYAAEKELLTTRKRQLLAAAACRRVARWLADPRSLRMPDVIERVADGAVDFDTFCEVNREAFAAARDADEAGQSATERSAAAAMKWLSPDETKLGRAIEFSTETFGVAALVSEQVIGPNAWLGEVVGQLRHPAFVAARDAEELVVAGFAREIIGNPFRRVAFRPEWRTDTVTGLARTAYDGPAFDRLPVLADALEEAGCDLPDLLAHCRRPGDHLRGCWALDLILDLDSGDIP